MKTSTKAILIGIITFFAFLWGNIVFGNLLIGILIAGGNDFQNSYFHPLYFAVILLISLVISCTYLIVSKIQALEDKIENSKNE